MTVISVEETPNRSARNDGKFRSYTREFLVKTNSRSDGPYTAGSAAGLPLIGSTHPEDFAAWCRSIDVSPAAGGSAQAWLVTFNYSSEWEMNENPLFEPAKISWSFEQFQRPAIIDLNGYAVLNSAGDPFDPPAMRDNSRPIVSVTKNLATVPTWLLNYQDTVNSLPFTLDGLLIATGKAKMNSISVSQAQSVNGVAFRTVQMDIHLQRDGWVMKLLDAGYRIKDGTTRITITCDGDGTEPSSPVPLDGSGDVLANPSTSNAVFGSFSVYYTADFNDLPLA